jgi:hypothetical protein
MVNSQAHGTDLKSECGSYFMEATGGDMMVASDRRRARSLKRKIHPALGPLNGKVKRGRGRSANPKILIG